MARVCVEDFPETNGFYMDNWLKFQIDVLIKNIKNDFDFTLLICGEGEVRVGKSKLAMDIGYYWMSEIKKRYGISVPFSVKDSYVFEGKELIKKGNYLGENHKYAPLIFDEAGADLEGKKVMTGATRDVLDYFRECGQYNMLNIIVIPEYFDLPIGIALSRSEFLINVFMDMDEGGLFKRGNFKFYSKRAKRDLYLKGKKDRNYKVTKPDFIGRFYNFYQIDEKEYRDAKHEAMKKRESKKRDKVMMQRNASWYLLCSDGMEVKLTQAQLGKRLEQLTGIFVPHQTISDAIKMFNVEQEYDKGHIPKDADAEQPS